MNVVTVGRVSTRRTARAHLALHGLAYCGSGSGRILADTAREITPDNAGDVCRRCAEAIRERLVDAIADTFRRPAAAGRRRRLETVVDMIATAGERAAHRAMVDTIRHRLTRSYPAPRPAAPTFTVPPGTSPVGTLALLHASLLRPPAPAGVDGQQEFPF